MTPVRIMNSFGMNDVNIVNSANIFSDNVDVNSNFREYYRDEHYSLVYNVKIKSAYYEEWQE